MLGLIILLTAAFLVHAHPRPYVIDLQTTLAIQGFSSISVLIGLIDFASEIDQADGHFGAILIAPSIRS